MTGEDKPFLLQWKKISAPLERDTLGCKGPGIGYKGHEGDAQAHDGKAFEQWALPLWIKYSVRESRLHPECNSHATVGRTEHKTRTPSLVPIPFKDSCTNLLIPITADCSPNYKLQLSSLGSEKARLGLTHRSIDICLENISSITWVYQELIITHVEKCCMCFTMPSNLSVQFKTIWAPTHLYERQSWQHKRKKEMVCCLTIAFWM